MANRITHEFNSILRDSEHIADFYSRGYLSGLRDGWTVHAPADVVNIDGINMYYRLSGCEFFGSKDENRARILDAAKSIVGTTGAARAPLAFTATNSQDGVKIYYGTRYDAAEQVRQILSGNFFSSLVSNEWVPPAELRYLQRLNGFIAGAGRLQPGAIDSLLNNFHGEKFMLNVVLLPIERQVVADEIYRINSLLDSLQRVSRTQLNIGSNRPRHFDNDNHDVVRAMEILALEKKRMSQGQMSGLWRTLVHISAPDEASYNIVSSALLSLMRGSSDAERDSSYPVLYDVDLGMVEKSNWCFPHVFLGIRDLGGLYSSSLAGLSDAESAAGLVAMPQLSHNGYTVRYYGEGTNPAGAFDLYPSRPANGEGVELGTLDNGAPFYFDIDVLRQHAFVTGTTRSGKSTSVIRLLAEAHSRGVPFVVIEASKKEYWDLVGRPGMNGIKVMSAGRDALDIEINPFQPEANTVLDTHIQNIIQAFLSLFEDSDPIPQILTELIYLCYEKRGWDVSRRVRRNESLDYPVLSDMLENLDECIESIGYGEEVKSNMRGVLRVRLSSLIRQAGKALNTASNISMEELFKSSAIIELDDFSERNKPFAASIIAIKANEYSKQCRMNGKLGRLLVVEEAHHIIPNPELRSASANAAECSKYFSNLLAEVSAYGTGVIIVDQRPSSISGSALANTGTKIVHNMREGDDIDMVSRSMSLGVTEAGSLSRLDVGQAIITSPGSGDVCRVRVRRIQGGSSVMKLGYIFGLTGGVDAGGLITQFERSYIESNGYSAASVSFCIRAIENRCGREMSDQERLVAAIELSTLSDENILLIRQELYELVMGNKD